MRFPRILLTCASILGVTSALGAQTLQFDSSNVAALGNTRAMIAADFDNDGQPDLASAHNIDNYVVILRAVGEPGRYRAVHQPVGRGPFDMASGDLNRDGRTDLVVATPDGNAIDILLMTGGTFPTRITLSATGASRGLTLADVTRDGRLDLVYSDYDRRLVVIRPGTGTGTFGAPIAEVPVGAYPQGVAAADLNRDGFVDIAVANTGSSQMSVLYGSSTGAYTHRSFSVGRAVNVLTLSDLNRDGWLDVAAAATSGNVVAVMRGAATGFTLAGTVATGSSPRSIASGDFNQDGRTDLVVTNRGGSSVTLMLGSATAAAMLTRWGDLAANPGTRGVATLDIDRDGRLDIAAGAESTSYVRLFRNDSVLVSPAFSFRASGVDDGIISYQATAVADFNRNGLPDLVTGKRVLLDGTTEVRLPMPENASLRDVVTSDFNRDGAEDILVGMAYFEPALGRSFQGFHTFHGDGRGAFTFAHRVDGLRSGNRLRLGDLDRDGLVDVVTNGRMADNTPAYFVVRRTSAAGEWRVDAYPTAGSVADMRLADMNNDGIEDLITSEVYPSVLNVRRGTGAGTFGAPAGIPMSDPGSGMQVGDLNHDGRLDAAFAAGGQLTVLLATASGWAPPVNYPVSPDGSGEFSYVWALHLADFTNDGALDVLANEGQLLPGTGDGRLGSVSAFAMESGDWATIADWNRDGLQDVVAGGITYLNERRTVNRMPTANAGLDRTMQYGWQFDEDANELWAGDSTDPDLHRLRFTWLDENNKVFSSGTWAYFRPRPPGTYTFTLVARDGRGGEATDTVTITITPEPELVYHVGWTWPGEAGWRNVEDATAASGMRLFYPNANAPKVTAPLATPAHYVDVGFSPDPTQTYKLWVRLKAQNNAPGNDSLWIQFTGGAVVDGTTTTRFKTGTTDGLAINLEECSGCGLSEWGWEDDGWGAVNRNGVLLRFPSGGGQTLRIQVREDGVSVDQIVLSAVKYRTSRPGAAKNDTTIVPQP